MTETKVLAEKIERMVCELVAAQIEETRPAELVLDEGEPPEDGIDTCVQLGLGGVGSGPGQRTQPSDQLMPRARPCETAAS